jgi:DTW domain-containing protein YfiP
MTSLVPKASCIYCRMPLALCLCSQLAPLTSSILFNFIIPRGELNKRTNTGILAHRLIENSRLTPYGTSDHPLYLSEALADDSCNLLLFPGGQNLSKFKGRKLNIIVPDSSWRQARKMATKLRCEAKLQFASLQPSRPSQYIISRGRPNETSLCTLEAIIEVFRVMEEHENADRLESIFLMFMHNMRKRSSGLY